MLSFSVEAAQDELGLLIKRGKNILVSQRRTVSEADALLRSEADWLREVYDTLTLVFPKRSQADTILETGPRHKHGALLMEVGDCFEQRMQNRLSLLGQFRDKIDNGPARVVASKV